MLNLYIYLSAQVGTTNNGYSDAKIENQLMGSGILDLLSQNQHFRYLTSLFLWIHKGCIFTENEK